MYKCQYLHSAAHITVTLMQTWMARFIAGHQDPQLAYTQIPSQMGGWRAQRGGLCAGAAPANHDVPRCFPTLEYSGDGRGV